GSLSPSRCPSARCTGERTQLRRWGEVCQRISAAVLRVPPLPACGERAGGGRSAAPMLLAVLRGNPHVAGMNPRELLKFLPIQRFRNPPPSVAVLRLDGVIGPRQWRTALSLGSHANALDRAFALSGLSGVALAINSPGGSPVQSALLFRRIRQLAEEK